MSASGASTLLRSTAVGAARLSAKPIASRVGAAGGVARSHLGYNATARTFVPSLCCRHSTSVADDIDYKPAREGKPTGPKAPDYAATEDKSALNYFARLYKLVAPKSTWRALSAARLLQACLNNVERKVWYTDALMTNEFLTKHLWLSTNVWVVSKRLLREGEEGKIVQEMMFDELWRETMRSMRSIDVDDMMLKKYLREAQQHTFATLCQYDHAYTLEDREERMNVFASALWRGIYGSNPDVESVVRKVAAHVDQELRDINSLDSQTVFDARIEFGVPPPGLSEGFAGKTSAEPLKEISYISESGLPDPDRGEDGQGRWRCNLAESGRVYFWHTRTEERTYDQPDEVDYVPAIMPVKANSPAPPPK